MRLTSVSLAAMRGSSSSGTEKYILKRSCSYEFESKVDKHSIVFILFSKVLVVLLKYDNGF